MKSALEPKAFKRLSPQTDFQSSSNLSALAGSGLVIGNNLNIEGNAGYSTSTFFNGPAAIRFFNGTATLNGKITLNGDAAIIGGETINGQITGKYNLISGRVVKT